MSERLDLMSPQVHENPYPFYQDFTCADLIETRASLRWEPSHDARKMIVTWVRTMQAETQPIAAPEPLASRIGT